MTASAFGTDWLGTSRIEIAADIEQMRMAGIPDEFIKAAILDKNLQATVMAEAAKNQTQGKEE